MSVWAIAVHVVPLGSDRERGNGVPDWWLEDGSRPTDTGRSVANTQRLSAWYAARRLAWLERVNSPYTAEVVSVAMHPLDGASVTDGVKVVLTSADAERALMHELEHALTRHAVTRNPIRRTDVKHAVPAHVQDIARALGWDLPPVDVYTPWLAGDVAACGRLTAAWLTLGLRVLERERLIPDFLELARR